MNPLSDFLKPLKNGHVLTEKDANVAKINTYSCDFRKAKAITEDNRQILLGEPGAELKDVDLVAGLWRVQKKFPYEIVHVRDIDVVLMDKIQHTESTNFEYWNAKLVGYNCYGPFIFSGEKPDFIVARYNTDGGPRWGYGQTIEAARAFLGLKIWDENKEFIHNVICKNKQK